MLVPGRPPSDSGPVSGWSFTVQPPTGSGLPGRVEAHGELDVAAVPELREAIAEAARTSRSHGPVVLDLSHVTFLDAAVLGALVAERQALHAAGGALTLSGVTPRAARLIRLAGLRETLGLD
jgi:anti-anti-sigma factor